MKVDPKAQLGAVAASPTQPFKKLLAEAQRELKQPAHPTPTVRAPVQAMPRAVAKGCVVNAQPTTTAQTLAHARTAANSEAQRLQSNRVEAHQHAHAAQVTRQETAETIRERTVERILEIINREFTPEGAPAGSHAAPQPQPQPQPLAPSTPPVPKAEVSPQAQAAQATALIERIEVFVRSQRPGLALTLNNSLGAHVEIERVGPREIALKLVGHRGPPTAEAVSRIREELRARGLKVCALEVA